MREKILIPLDGSPFAEVVIPCAEEIAGKVGAEIALVSVSESGNIDAHALYLSYLDRVADRISRHRLSQSREEVI